MWFVGVDKLIYWKTETSKVFKTLEVWQVAWN